MAQTINTNVLSLTAQRNLNKSQSSLNTSIQRLSSGLRINSAKDDAAGLSITDRMTSQIRGLNQAVRNANDGISLAQTAEGALAESSNNLQRIRELAIQSANSTNSASDRAALNSEVQQLLSEIQRTATTTQFNGQNVIDGTFQSSQFQVGANANQTINVSISGATTSLLGSYQATSSAVTSTAFDGSGLKINGVTIGASAATSAAGFTQGSAAAKAVAINAATSSTGVSATASTTLSGGAAPVAGKSLGNGVLKINGISIGAIAGNASAVVQGQNAASAINDATAQTGVSASVNMSTGALTLTSDEGRDIQITSAAGTDNEATDIYNSVGLLASAAAPTGNDERDVVFAQTNGVGGAAADDIQDGDTVTIDGIVYEFDTDASVTGTNISVAVNASDNDAAVGAALGNAIDGQRALGTTTVATTGTPGATVNVQQALLGGNAISVATSDAAAIDITDAGTNGTDATYAATTTYGTLTLSSAENFSLTGSSSAMLTAGGLTSANPALSALSSVDISSVAGANSAIAVLDGALAQISSSRADLGAVQNRFESTMANLGTASENLSAARSRILDADFAAETANLTRGQILQQAGVAMVSQANALPQSVLSLLQ